jgi:hypothetical protein
MKQTISMQARNRRKKALALSALCVATVAASPAQTLTVLNRFNVTDNLVQLLRLGQLGLTAKIRVD